VCATNSVEDDNGDSVKLRGGRTTLERFRALVGFDGSRLVTK